MHQLAQHPQAPSSVNACTHPTSNPYIPTQRLSLSAAPPPRPPVPCSAERLHHRSDLRMRSAATKSVDGAAVASCGDLDEIRAMGSGAASDAFCRQRSWHNQFLRHHHGARAPLPTFRRKPHSHNEAEAVSIQPTDILRADWPHKHT